MKIRRILAVAAVVGIMVLVAAAAWPFSGATTSATAATGDASTTPVPTLLTRITALEARVATLERAVGQLQGKGTGSGGSSLSGNYSINCLSTEGDVELESATSDFNAPATITGARLTSFRSSLCEIRPGR